MEKAIKIHFIGIGGIGMSGIAEILLSMGHRVSGSDRVLSHVTERLKQLGAEIFKGHSEENIKEAKVVVYSSAITKDNKEMIAAQKNRIPIMKRAEILADLMRFKKGVAIAGTHGKTTTTSMLATILEENKHNPTYIIGGVVSHLKTHAQEGTGEFIIVESDESDGSFLLLDPIYSIITNIDNDHLDYYHTEEKQFKSFKKFANKVPFYGLCALNVHDKKLLKIASQMKKPCVTFGIDNALVNADYLASQIKSFSQKVNFQLKHKNKSVKICLETPGSHNILNFLGAAAIAHNMGLSLEEIAYGISHFKGVGRRFQKLLLSDSLEIIDDYGHHPTEIEVTIKTLREIRPNKKIVVFFEPHRFTRTRDCWHQFLTCFGKSDKVYLGPIYPASEPPLDGISSKKLANDINQKFSSLVSSMAQMEDMKDILTKNKNQGWVVLTLGAGSIGRIIREWIDEQ